MGGPAADPYGDGAGRGPACSAAISWAGRTPARYGHGAVLVAAAAVGDGVFLLAPALHGRRR
ncbi:hypothetical protein [Actinoplanes sp. NPDC049599]|uniref:hypothetical protein n=1 Tax=Actinoplanes sp. NPDC049599 TaxID=3363903 RepID=UPI0037A67D7B